MMDDKTREKNQGKEQFSERTRKTDKTSQIALPIPEVPTLALSQGGTPDCHHQLLCPWFA